MSDSVRVRLKPAQVLVAYRSVFPDCRRFAAQSGAAVLAFGGDIRAVPAEGELVPLLASLGCSNAPEFSLVLVCEFRLRSADGTLGLDGAGPVLGSLLADFADAGFVLPKLAGMGDENVMERIAYCPAVRGEADSKRRRTWAVRKSPACAGKRLANVGNEKLLSVESRLCGDRFPGKIRHASGRGRAPGVRRHGDVSKLVPSSCWRGSGCSSYVSGQIRVVTQVR